MAPVLGYWKLSGLAHSIRLALHYNEVEYVDKMYEQPEPPQTRSEEWWEDRAKLGLEVPNLPYYVDGDVKMVESQAILRHIGRKFNLMGDTEGEMIRNDIAISFQADMRTAVVGVAYNPNYESLKDGLLKTFPEKLGKFVALLGDKKFFAADKVLACDFLVYDVLDIYRHFLPGCLDNFPTLVAYMERFEALPTIKAYIESDAYMRKPFTGKSAKWGN